MPLAQVFASCR